MIVCHTIAEYREAIVKFRAEGDSIGLVTTMGGLHDGHMALVKAARTDNDRVVATIFVNPTQFGNPDDFAKYPGNDDDDLAKFRNAGVDAVLLPTVDEIYPEGEETIVETTRLSGVYHGAVRPGHFQGVATVVTKLFNIADADTAYFGEKDYQQLAVIRRMVRDLHVPIRIIGVPTVREADGLAMSSRNVRLTPEDRAAAPVLNASLNAAEHLVRSGTTTEELTETIARVIKTEPRAQLKGLDIVDAATFQAATGPIRTKIGIMISAQFGEVLLIDQREMTP